MVDRLGGLDGCANEPPKLRVLRTDDSVLDVPLEALFGLGDAWLLLAWPDVPGGVEHLPTQRLSVTMLRVPRRALAQAAVHEPA